jgi:hypothetical protein
MWEKRKAEMMELLRREIPPPPPPPLHEQKSFAKLKVGDWVAKHGDTENLLRIHKCRLCLLGREISPS